MYFGTVENRERVFFCQTPTIFCEKTCNLYGNKLNLLKKMVLDVKSFTQVYAQGVLFFNRNLKYKKQKKKINGAQGFPSFFHICSAIFVCALIWVEAWIWVKVRKVCWGNVRIESQRHLFHLFSTHFFIFWTHYVHVPTFFKGF